MPTATKTKAKDEPKPRLTTRPGIQLLPWNELDGLAEGHYAARPPGHTCIWTCRWHMQSLNGVVEPGAILDLDRAVPLQLFLEASDVADQMNNPDCNAARRLVAAYTADRPVWRDQAIAFLTRARPRYEEFLCPWDRPVKIFYQHWRPGWGDGSSAHSGISHMAGLLGIR